MTVILSPSSVESANVADEWSYAIDEGKTVIPLMYLPCDVPMRLRRMNWIDFSSKPISEAFKEYVETLGSPDYRPNNRFELARRDGMIFISLPHANIRISFVYTDYPEANAFLRTVWFTLLWSMIDRNSVKTSDNFDYGQRWSLKNTVTNELCPAPTQGMLIHEIGIEPNCSLEVVLN